MGSQKGDPGLGWRQFLRDPAPWSAGSIRLFRVVGVLTVLLVLAGYGLLWMGYRHLVAAWLAMGGQGVTVGLTAVLVGLALRRRRQDIVAAHRVQDTDSPERRS